MFDRALLPSALFEFVILADTHYLRAPEGAPVEFASRLKQAARAEAALALAASLEPAFLVHLGDLVQEYPGTPGFSRAITEALQQLESHRIAPRFVAGNHDVGDKPDPTMPGPPVLPDVLAAYHARIGSSWYAFDYLGCHFMILNSQVLNSSLPEATSQRVWAERDFAEHAGRRLFVFLHMPPFLWDETEPGLGHYDNLDEPARGWLLDLVRRYRVELLAAGHTHFAFFTRVGPTRFLVAPSPSFTRPGFAHVFTSCPPPEQGRDDKPKLGFYLARVCGDRTDLHFIRTAGAERPGRADAGASARVLTRSPAALAGSPLGVTLHHPLAPSAEVPAVWPSMVRQRVRNDYPLLACLDLGVKHVRAPAADLRDPLQSERLAMLREEGVRVVATALWTEPAGFLDQVTRHAGQVDGWEVQIPGSLEPPPECLRALAGPMATTGVPVTLAAVVRQPVPGKQHPRTRVGYTVDELEGLSDALAAAGVDRVLCVLDRSLGPWESVQRMSRLRRLDRIGHLDCAFDLTGLDDREKTCLAAEALLAMALLPESRLYLSPLIDLDRTMDVGHGILDPLCNPRPVYEVLRCLNTLVFHRRETRPFQVVEARGDGVRIRTLRGARAALSLLVPEGTEGGTSFQASPNALLPGYPVGAPVVLYWLCEGTSSRVALGDAPRALEASGLRDPVAVVAPEWITGQAPS